MWTARTVYLSEIEGRYWIVVVNLVFLLLLMFVLRWQRKMYTYFGPSLCTEFHLIEFSHFFLCVFLCPVPRPKPLSTVITQRLERRANSQSALILAVMDKVAEAGKLLAEEDGEGRKEEEPDKQISVAKRTDFPERWVFLETVSVARLCSFGLLLLVVGNIERFAGEVSKP